MQTLCDNKGFLFPDSKNPYQVKCSMARRREGLPLDDAAEEETEDEDIGPGPRYAVSLDAVNTPGNRTTSSRVGKGLLGGPPRR